MPSLADVVDLLHEWYPPDTAMDFDAVGLVAGDPAAEVARVMFAVDPTIEVAREAVEWGADLLVVHHPLFLTPVSSVAATTPKGRTLHTLTSGGCALLTAHTNADQAASGVSESLAYALGLRDLAPILPSAPGSADGSGPGRHGRRDDARRLRGARRRGAADHRARRTRRGGVRPAGAAGRGVRRGGRLPARRAGRRGRRRLRHERPAPPPGGGVPRARGSGAGGRGALGGGVDVAPGGGGSAARRAGR